MLTHYGWDLPSPRSGWVTVRCGAHGERKPSCRVNYDIGAVRCMACDFHGDVISIIRQQENCSFNEAVRIAGELSNVDVSAMMTGSRRKRATKASRAYVPPRRRTG